MPMGTARTSGVVVALLVLLPFVGGGVGCQKDCDIEPGTPATELPLLSGATRGEWCGGDGEYMLALTCCTFSTAVLDGGVVECRGGLFTVDCTKVPPAEFFWLGSPYGGGLCDPGGSSRSEWRCGVFVIGGRAVGSCRSCPPD